MRYLRERFGYGCCILAAAVACNRGGTAEVPAHRSPSGFPAAGTKVDEQKKSDSPPKNIEPEPIRFGSRPLDNIQTTVLQRLPLPDRLELHALEVEPSAGVQPLMDDDLNTAWSCDSSSLPNCRVILEFPAVATVSGVRIFSSSAVLGKEGKEAARPKRVRIETEAGFVEAALEDTRNYQHVLFAQALETRAVAVSVLSVYSGGRSKKLQIAEIDAFGSKGVKRAPLAIAADRIPATGTEGNMWQPSTVEGTHANATWIDVLDGRGESRRLFKGSMITGGRRGEYAMVSEIRRAGCPSGPTWFRSGFTLIDLRNRMFYQTDMKGAVDPAVWTNAAEDGFATRGDDVDRGEEIYTAVKIEHGEVRRRTWKGAQGEGEPLELTQWLGNTVSAPETLPDWFTVRQADAKDRRWIAARFDDETGIAEADWNIYTLQNDRLLFVLQDACPGPFGTRVLSVSKRREITDRLDASVYNGQIVTAVLRDMVLIGAEKNSGLSGDIFVVDEGGGLKRLYKNKLFYSASPPPSCRCVP